MSTHILLDLIHIALHLVKWFTYERPCNYLAVLNLTIDRDQMTHSIMPCKVYYAAAKFATHIVEPLRPI